MQLDQIAAALAKAQAEFPAVPKSGKNPHLKNDYSTLDDIIATVRKPLANHGLSFVQLLGSDESGVTLNTMLLHESGQWLEGTVSIAPGEGNRGVNAMQALGSAITYMKRYSLSAMLGISTEGDTDGEGATAKAAPRNQAPARQAQPAQPSNRPLSGPQVREVIRKKSGWLADVRDTEGEPITQGQVKGVAGLLSDAVKRDGMNQELMDKARHDILGYLFGVHETMRLTKREASAIISWLKEEDSWDVNQYARQEAENVLTALAKDAGQTELPFDDEPPTEMF